MDRYTHSYHGEQSAALDVLPDLSPAAHKEVQATGTGDAKPNAKGLALYLAQKRGFRESEGDSGILKSAKKASLSRPLKSRKNKDFPDKRSVKRTSRWGARAVEWTGLENRRGLRVTVGSNPTPTAFLSPRS